MHLFYIFAPPGGHEIMKTSFLVCLFLTSFSFWQAVNASFNVSEQTYQCLVKKIGSEAIYASVVNENRLSVIDQAIKLNGDLLYKSYIAIYGDEIYQMVRDGIGDDAIYKIIRENQGDDRLYTIIRETIGDAAMYAQIRTTVGDASLFDGIRDTPMVQLAAQNEANALGIPREFVLADRSFQRRVLNSPTTREMILGAPQVKSAVLDSPETRDAIIAAPETKQAVLETELVKTATLELPQTGDFIIADASTKKMVLESQNTKNTVVGLSENRLLYPECY